MTFKRKVSDVWKDGLAPYIKVDGTWRFAKEAWIKIGGTWKYWFLQGGILDSSFGGVSAPNFNNDVEKIAVQSDKKIVAVGEFTTVDGTTSNRIARLNTDGTLDTTFTTNIGTGAEAIVTSLAIQPDDKIVIGGQFTTINGATSNRIARLNSIGTLDESFTVGGASNNTISAILIQSDDKIVIGGQFTTINGTTSNRIARLNSDGTLDTTFTTNIGTGVNDSVLALGIQPNNQIVIGGTFTTINGTTSNRIARLNSNGTLDTTFSTNIGTGANDTINAISIGVGKIVVGGLFTTFNGVSVNRIARLESGI